MRNSVGIALGLGLCCLLTGDEAKPEGKQNVQVSKTEHMDFPSGGTLRMKNSTGDLTVEAWDRPDIEITTIKSTKEEYDPRDREKAAHLLDQVHVTAERHGEEIVITTDFPFHHVLPPPGPLGVATSFYLEYNIKVPRNARLMIDHNIGDIDVEEITGDVHITARQATIVLHLPQDRQYAINAKSDFGAVNSDFPGHATRKAWLTGHAFLENPPNAAQKLFLRTGYGDIVLLRTTIPPEPGPTSR